YKRHVMKVVTTLHVGDKASVCKHARLNRSYFAEMNQSFDNNSIKKTSSQTKMARIMIAVTVVLLLLFCNKFIVGENADKNEFEQEFTIDEMIDNYSQASKPSTGGA
uniref:Uncharacterized protein n=1 Tax=Clytia hemisphaerica TaxID=252671 RepID=A0A7M5V4C3_9CNID